MPMRRSRAPTHSQRLTTTGMASASERMSRGVVVPLPTLLAGAYSPSRRTGELSSPFA